MRDVQFYLKWLIIAAIFGVILWLVDYFFGFQAAVLTGLVIVIGHQIAKDV